jgi:hypothetical protein
LAVSGGLWAVFGGKRARFLEIFSNNFKKLMLSRTLIGHASRDAVPGIIAKRNHSLRFAICRASLSNTEDAESAEDTEVVILLEGWRSGEAESPAFGRH